MTKLFKLFIESIALLVYATHRVRSRLSSDNSKRRSCGATGYLCGPLAICFCAGCLVFGWCAGDAVRYLLQPEQSIIVSVTSGEERHEPVEEICGDDVCGFSEVEWCSQDCPVCGDWICSDSETADSCQEDCSTCGDGFCSGREEGWCVSDCIPCIERATGLLMPYSVEVCGPASEFCTVCGDGHCDDLERRTGCPDCGEQKCGDGTCTYWEFGACEADCPATDFH